MTYKQAQRIYGIQGRSTVLVWLRKHGSLDWSRPNHQVMNPQNQKKLLLKRSNDWSESWKMTVKESDS